MENQAERMKALSQGLIAAQEAERRRVARELHDEIGQALTAVKIDLQAAQRIKEPEAIARHLEESIAIVERALQQVRNLSLDLRPSLLDDLGLVTALRWYVDRQAQRTGMAMQFTAESMDSRLSTELETACFRVAQEALTNVIRHAGAVSVGIDLYKTLGCLTLMIRDNGKGFDVQAVGGSGQKPGASGHAGAGDDCRRGDGNHFTARNRNRNPGCISHSGIN